MHQNTGNKQWTYDALQNIYFGKSESEQDCIRSLARGANKRAFYSDSPQINRKYGNKGKFIKAVQECLNWEKPDNQDLMDQYEQLVKVGQQPDLIKLSHLETVDEAQEWQQDRSYHRGSVQKQKIESDNTRLNKIRLQQKLRDQKPLKPLVSKDLSHQRTVTFDYIDIKSNQSQIQQNQAHPTQVPHIRTNPCESTLLLPAQKSGEYKFSEKGFTPSKISENMTTDSSRNSRTFANSLSPTKLARKKTNFSNIGNDIMSPSSSKGFKGLQLNLNRTSVIDSESEYQSQQVSPMKNTMKRAQLFQNDKMPSVQESIFRSTQKFEISSSRANRVINTQNRITVNQLKEMTERPTSSPLFRKGSSCLDNNDF